MNIVNRRPATPTKNSVGPLRPKSPSPCMERIQTMRPTAVMKAPTEPTAGHGLGFTRW